jgi:hypothetical protein
MAVRRLNYTGRKRLRQRDLLFAIEQPPDSAPAFVANINLEEFKLSPNANVFVEAYRQTTWMRFRFGTVGNLRPLDDLELTEFDSAEGILFRVRVTSPDNKGLLLAEADRIRPRIGAEEEESNRIPLLPVKPDNDLGEEIWRVDFTDRPILLINAAVGDWRALAKEPVFVSLVYPAVLRQILERILYVEEYFEIDDLDDWRSQWLLFATHLLGITEAPTEDQYDDWINESVEVFCRRFGILSRFRTWWSEETKS